MTIVKYDVMAKTESRGQMPLKRDTSSLSHDVAPVSLSSPTPLICSRSVYCSVSVKILEPDYIAYNPNTLDSSFTL